jgi:hypothetical protein
MCLLLLATGFGVTGCANRARTTATYAPAGAAPSASLPRPVAVIVNDFAVSPSEVQLDSGVRAEVMRTLNGTPSNAERAQTAAQARSVLTQTLVQRIQAMGLSATTVHGTVPASGNVVNVQGQILDIDEGNRTRRTLIGFGAGKEQVGADAQVFYVRPGDAPQLLQSFEAESDTGHTPGMAAGMGAGAAAGHVAESAALGGGIHVAKEKRGTPEDLARSLGNSLADRIGKLFAQQGWVAPPAQ